MKKKNEWDITDPKNPCPLCGGIEWFHFMDSLADMCKECKCVRIGSPGKYEYQIPKDKK